MFLLQRPSVVRGGGSAPSPTNSDTDCLQHLSDVGTCAAALDTCPDGGVSGVRHLQHPHCDAAEHTLFTVRQSPGRPDGMSGRLFQVLPTETLQSLLMVDETVHGAESLSAVCFLMFCGFSQTLSGF